MKRTVRANKENKYTWTRMKIMSDLTPVDSFDLDPVSEFEAVHEYKFEMKDDKEVLLCCPDKTKISIYKQAKEFSFNQFVEGFVNTGKLDAMIEAGKV